MVYQPPYPAGHRKRDFLKAEAGRVLADGVIEPCTAELASPIVVVPMKDGNLRSCVDYRLMNAVTPRDYNPIPRIDEGIDSLGDARNFISLDYNSGPSQLEV